MLPLPVLFRLIALSRVKSTNVRGMWPLDYSYHRRVVAADLIDYHSIYTVRYERGGILVDRGRGEPITIGRLAGNEITSTFLNIGDTIHGGLRPFRVLTLEDEESGTTVVIDGCTRLTHAARSLSQVPVTFLILRGTFWPQHPDLGPLQRAGDFRDLLIT
jgi:hypothetical protein